jgi:DNA-directed RNA polymerase subunit RPC12/RpoP
MACPNCGGKVTYQYDDGDDCAVGVHLDDRLERCAACGAVFDIDDHADEDDDCHLARSPPACASAPTITDADVPY